MQLEKLASEWIDAQRIDKDDQRLANTPAIDAVIELGIDDPETLWLLMLEILSRKEIDDDVITVLGAGPLEDLIAENGEEFIGRIKTELGSNTKLASAMTFVWVSEDVRPSVKEYTDLGCQFVSAKAT